MAVILTLPPATNLRSGSPCARPRPSTRLLYISVKHPKVHLWEGGREVDSGEGGESRTTDPIQRSRAIGLLTAWRPPA